MIPPQQGTQHCLSTFLLIPIPFIVTAILNLFPFPSSSQIHPQSPHFPYSHLLFIPAIPELCFSPPSTLSFLNPCQAPFLSFSAQGKENLTSLRRLPPAGSDPIVCRFLRTLFPSQQTTVSHLQHSRHCQHPDEKTETGLAAAHGIAWRQTIRMGSLSAVGPGSQDWGLCSWRQRKTAEIYKKNVS